MYDLPLMNTQESFAEPQIKDKEEDEEENKEENKEKNIFCDNSDD
jgi:hypothetical protein